MRYDTITADTNPLWEAYFRTRAVEERNVLFLALKDYFGAIVNNWMKKRSYLFGRADDVQAAGSYYLLDAITRVSPEYHPVKRMKYLIQTVLWQLHTYFNTVDKGTKRFHDKSINRNTRFFRLERKIDIADRQIVSPVNQLIEKESVDVIYQALDVGKKTGRLSPKEISFLRGVLREVNRLPGMEYNWNWRNNCSIRFQALIRELSGLPFTLCSKLRVPAKRFDWEVDSRGREMRIDKVLDPSYILFQMDDAEYPREVTFHYGKWRFLIYRPTDAEDSRQWQWQARWIRHDSIWKKNKFRWGWIVRLAQYASAVRYGYGDISKIVMSGQQNCLDKLKELKVIDQ